MRLSQKSARLESDSGLACVSFFRANLTAHPAASTLRSHRYRETKAAFRHRDEHHDALRATFPRHSRRAGHECRSPAAPQESALVRIATFPLRATMLPERRVPRAGRIGGLVGDASLHRRTRRDCPERRSDWVLVLFCRWATNPPMRLPLMPDVEPIEPLGAWRSCETPYARQVAVPLVPSRSNCRRHGLESQTRSARSVLP